MMNSKPYICYCFKYTEDDIMKDLEENRGNSTILAKITESKQQGTCNCEEFHPEHR